MDKYTQLIADSVKARKLILPETFNNLPVECPNYLLLTDETVSLIDDRDELICSFVSELATDIGIQNSCWSTGENTDFTINPFPGAIGVYYDGGWGKAGEVKFRKKLENVTLVDIWKACDKLIDRSGDHHHVFIEELKFDGQYVSFWCGS